MIPAVDLTQKRILITGATSSVAKPIVAALAKNNTVFAAARYKKEQDKSAVEAVGALPVTLDLAKPDFAALPQDIDYVLNFAVAKSGRWQVDIPVNAEGIGKLMLHYRDVKAVLHCSSTAVYQYACNTPLDEHASLGDSHRPLMETYSISKIAAETVASFVAKQFAIPLTIARLNVPYGDFACWPFFHYMMMKNNMAIDVHADQPNYFSPIHEKDYIAAIPHLLAAASTEVCTVNLAGNEAVSVEQWCTYIGELTGLTPKFNVSPKALGSVIVDTQKLQSIAGVCQVPWQQGLKSMLNVMAPGAVIK